MAMLGVGRTTLFGWVKLFREGARVSALAPLGTVSALSVGLVVLVALIAALMAWGTRHALALPRTGTWDCGYARPTSRMQYSASSFAQTVVVLFRWVQLRLIKSRISTL